MRGSDWFSMLLPYEIVRFLYLLEGLVDEVAICTAEIDIFEPHFEHGVARCFCVESGVLVDFV